MLQSERLDIMGLITKYDISERFKESDLEKVVIDNFISILNLIV